MTSQLRQDTRPDDVMIEEWQKAGLLKPSAIKPVVATLEKSLVTNRLGAIEGRDLAALETVLAEILGRH